MLINGSVPGILDEDYTIPEGVTLVVPDGSTLLMQSVSTDGTDYSTEEILHPGLWDAGHTTAPMLTVSETAKLIVESTAQILFEQITDLVETWVIGGMAPTTKMVPKTYQPSITVNGSLELWADLVDALIRFGNASDFSGDGILTDSTVKVDGDRSEGLDGLALEDSAVILTGAGADVVSLRLGGDSTLVYTGESTIGGIELGDDSILTVEQLSGREPVSETGMILTVDGPITAEGSGAELHLGSGILELSEECSISNVEILTDYVVEAGSILLFPLIEDILNLDLDEGDVLDGTGMIYDYSGTLTGSTTPRVAVSPVKPAEDAPIPAQMITYYEEKDEYGGVTAFIIGQESRPAFTVQSGDDPINYETLKDYYGEELTFLLDVEYDDGSFGTLALTDLNSGEIPAGNVAGIRIMDQVSNQDLPNAGGGTEAQTSTTYTGTGLLGGSGVGDSAAGGTQMPILTGSGITQSIGGEEEPGGGNGSGSSKTAGDAMAAQGIMVWAEPVKDEQDVYVLRASVNGMELSTLIGRREVRMDYRPEAGVSTDKLYVVFRNADGTLNAVKARYDAVNGRLVFTAGRLGRFVVVSMQYDGPEFSEGFYEALGRLEEVKKLG